MLKSTLFKLKRFLAEEDGPTALEYVVMVSMILVVCLVAINSVGQLTNANLDNSANAISTAM